MWKTRCLRLTPLLLGFLCLAMIPACSTSKGVVKSKQTSRTKQSAPDSNAALIGQGEEGVKAKLGEPTVISKTNEGHVLWVYRPTWKIIPNDTGTMYVEFAEGKAVKIFKK